MISIRYFSVLISDDEEATFICLILFLLYQLPWTDSLQIRQTDRQIVLMLHSYLIISDMFLLAG